MLLSKASLLTILLHIHTSKSVGTGAGSSSIHSPDFFENGDEVLHCMTEYGAPNLEDCRAALKKLADEAQVHNPMDFEWISLSNMPRHPELIQLHLPWAYVHGTCTIRIARPPYGLISGPLDSHSIIRTFGDLKSAANRLLSWCVLGNRQGGFAMEGRLEPHGKGVLFMQIYSENSEIQGRINSAVRSGRSAPNQWFSMTGK